MGLGLRVEGLGLRLQGLGLRALAFKVQGIRVVVMVSVKVLERSVEGDLVSWLVMGIIRAIIGVIGYEHTYYCKSTRPSK